MVKFIKGFIVFFTFAFTAVYGATLLLLNVLSGFSEFREIATGTFFPVVTGATMFAGVMTVLWRLNSRNKIKESKTEE